MSDSIIFRRLLNPMFLLFALLLAMPVGAATITADKTEIALGESARITLKGTPLLAIVRWEASAELELLASDNKGATVRGKAAGNGTVTMKLNLNEKSLRIVVREPVPGMASSSDAATVPPVLLRQGGATGGGAGAPTPAAAGASGKIMFSVAPKAPTADLINRAMNEALEDTGNPFIKLIKQGSYISRQNYRDPLLKDKLGQFIADASDHDARLFISLENVSAERAREVWHGFQGRLRTKIAAMAQQAGYSSDEIQIMLKSVNLYPPAQLLKTIERNEQAIAAFMRMGNYPNLLEVGEEGAEGLYTKATKFIRQAYETGERVEVAELVADDGATVFRLNIKHTAAAEHAIEEVGATNLEGLTQAAEYQFNEARKALKEGKFDSARKNLDRAKDKLKRARDLVGVQGEGGVLKELELVEKELDEAFELAFNSADEAKALLGKGKAIAANIERNLVKKATVEFTALESLAGRESARSRALMKGILEGEGNWATLRLKLEQTSESAITTLGTGARLAYKHWFIGLIALWELKEFPAAIEKEGAAKAGTRLATVIAGLANPTFGYAQLFSAVYMITGELLVDWVSSHGYGAVVGRQDCMDLMAGLYTVPGREQNIEDRSCEPIQGARQLACRIYDQHGLRQHLAAGHKFRQELLPPLLVAELDCHARAAAKHWDDVESKHDEGVQQALVSKCLSPLVRSWAGERQLVINEIDALRQGIEEHKVALIASPAKLSKPGVVRLGVSDTLDHAAVEAAIKARTACLGGVHADPRFNRSRVWTVNGREFAKTDDKGEATIALDAPGSHELCVSIQYDWRVEGLPIVALEEGLSGKAARRGCTSVAVDAPPKDEKKPGDDVVQPVLPPDDGKKKNDGQKDTTGKDGTAPLPTGKGKLSATAAGNWTGGMQPDGSFKLTRNPAKIKGPCGWDSSVTASVSAEFATGAADDKAIAAARAKTLEEVSAAYKKRAQGCTPNDMAVGLFSAGGVEGVSSVSLGAMSGSMVDYALWIRRGSGGWMSGYTGSYMGDCGDGAAHGKAGGISFHYRVNGGGCWDNSDRAYLVTQSLAAQQEARAIVMSLRPGDGSVTSSEYKGPKYDGSDLPKVVLFPAKLDKLKPGEIATVTAEVENLKPEDTPLKYHWDGTFVGEAAKLLDRASVNLKPDRPGKYHVGVNVDGARFGLGGAGLDYEVADVKIHVERVPNANKAVPVGGKADLKAVLTVDGKPADADVFYRWQPNTEVAFSRTESADAATTTATLTRLGKQKIFVEALQRKGAVDSTLAASDTIEIEVIQPKLSLDYAPKPPRVGQEVKVTVKDEPRLDDKDAGFRWEHLGDAGNPGTMQDERVFSYKPRSTKPVTVKVRGYLRDGNVDLGEQEVKIEAKAYDVSIGAPRATGPKLQVWQCDTQLGGKCGMVDAPQGQFGVFQDILLSARINPAPPAPRYQWSVDGSGACGFPGSGAEIRLNCSNTGSVQVRLQVKDSDGAVLGEASQTVSVSVSAEQQRPDKRLEQGQQAAQQSADLAGQGRYEEAVKALEDARKQGVQVAPDTARNIAAGAKAAASAAEKQRDFDKSRRLFDAARKADPNDIEAHRGVNNAPVYQKRVDEVRAWQKEVDRLIANGDWDKSEARLEDIKRWEALIPGEMFPETKALIERQDKGYAAYKADIEPRKQAIGHYLAKSCLDKARAGIMDMRAKHLIWIDQDWTRVFLDAIDEGKRTCSMGNVPLQNNCGRDCELDGVAGGGGLDGLLSGRTYNCVAVDARGGRNWPCTVKFGGSNGNVSGELSWPTLGSVHRIAGSLSGQTLRFTETSAIKAGGAHLNVSYTLTASGNTLSGTYQDPADRSTGTFTIDLGGTGGTGGTGGGIATGNPVSINANGASLSLDSGMVQPNAPLSLRWSAPANVPDNTWIGLQPAAPPHGKTSVNDQHDIAYRYIDKTRSGTMSFTAPGAEGQYDFRMNNPANDRELASLTFTVKVTVAPATLALAKDSYAPGEPVKVGFTASPGYPKNTWVGLIPSDKPHGKTSVNDQYDMAYKYLDGKSQGELAFTAPVPEGSYDLRMNETSNDKEVASVTFKVAVPVAGAELALAKGAYKPGEEIRLGFKASPLLPKNTWVGLIPSDKPHGKTSVNDQYDAAYKYLDGKTGGELVFTAPGSEGNWDFRLNETSNDKEIVSLGFRVARNAPATGTPVKATVGAGASSTPVSSGTVSSGPVTSGPATPETGIAGITERDEITSRSWRFGRGDGTVIAEPVRLTAAGKMQGYYHPNEDNWTLENGVLVFRDPAGKVITRFTGRKVEAGRLVLSGPFLPNPATTHVLTEVGRDGQSAAQGDYRALLGNWSIDANGYAGKVEFSESGGKLAGRVWFDAHQAWESLQNIAFDGRTLSFLRPGPSQRYSGTLSGNEVRGTFESGGRYAWVITRQAATAAVVTIGEFTWQDMAEDRVGEWGSGKPNGTPDGHFRLALDLSGRATLASISVWSADAAGNKSGGHIWHTRNSNNWMLGVVHNGRQLNATHVPSLGSFEGRVVFDLYANSSGWFKAGQHFLVEVVTAEGRTVTKLLRIGAVGTPTAAVGGTAAATLALDKTRFTPGESIAVRFTAPTSWPNDAWVGILPSSVAHGSEAENDRHDITYQYLNKRGSGTLTFTAPAAGNWDLRLHDTDGGGKEYASVSFQVGTDTAAPGGRDYTSTWVTGGGAGATPTTAAGGRDYTGVPIQGDPAGFAAPGPGPAIAKLIFEIGNVGGVGNGPTREARFTLDAPHVVTLIRNYHWNQGRGATPGTIALRGRDQRTFGPWPAAGSPGQGGVANAYWSVRPNVTLPAGVYVVIDSDPATWAQNAASNNAGFTRIEGYPAGAAPAGPPSGAGAVDGAIKQVDDLLDAVKSFKDIFGK